MTEKQGASGTRRAVRYLNLFGGVANGAGGIASAVENFATTREGQPSPRMQRLARVARGIHVCSEFVVLATGSISNVLTGVDELRSGLYTLQNPAGKSAVPAVASADDLVHQTPVRVGVFVNTSDVPPPGFWGGDLTEPSL